MAQGPQVAIPSAVKARRSVRRTAMNIKDEAVEAACKAYADSRYGEEVSWPLDFSMGDKIDMRAALTAALPHMGGPDAKVFEFNGRIYFYERRSDRWRDWWHFIGSQPVASHEPAPEPAKDGT